MPIVEELSHRDDLIERYKAGVSAAQIAREVGTSLQTILRVLGNRGVEVRSRPNLLNPDAAGICAAYVGGESELSIATRLGISRNVVTRILRERGVPRRSQSEAETLKWRTRRCDRSEVERSLRAAWIANRSRRAPRDEVMRAKATRAARGLVGSHGRYETELRDTLAARGLSFVWQYPIKSVRSYRPGRGAKPYRRVDLASKELAVAVEIEGTWAMNPRGSMREKRIEDILDAGFSVLFLIVPPRRTPVCLEGLANHVVAFAQAAGGHEAPVRQYGMIDRHGHPVTPPGFDLNHRPRVPGF